MGLQGRHWGHEGLSDRQWRSSYRHELVRSKHEPMEVTTTFIKAFSKDSELWRFWDLVWHSLMVNMKTFFWV